MKKLLIVSGLFGVAWWIFSPGQQPVINQEVPDDVIPGDAVPADPVNSNDPQVYEQSDVVFNPITENTLLDQLMSRGNFSNPNIGRNGVSGGL